MMERSVESNFLPYQLFLPCRFYRSGSKMEETVSDSTLPPYSTCVSSRKKFDCGEGDEQPTVFLPSCYVARSIGMEISLFYQILLLDEKKKKNQRYENQYLVVHIASKFGYGFGVFWY